MVHGDLDWPKAYSTLVVPFQVVYFHAIWRSVFTLKAAPAPVGLRGLDSHKKNYPGLGCGQGFS